MKKVSLNKIYIFLNSRYFLKTIHFFFFFDTVCFILNLSMYQTGNFVNHNIIEMKLRVMIFGKKIQNNKKTWLDIETTKEKKTKTIPVAVSEITLL